MITVFIQVCLLKRLIKYALIALKFKNKTQGMWWVVEKVKFTELHSTSEQLLTLVSVDTSPLKNFWQ